MIYFIRSICDCGDKFVTIGFVQDDITLQERMRDLQTGNPHKLQVIGTMEGDKATETAIGMKFISFCRRGEWFRLTPEIEAFIAENDCSRGVAPARE